MPLFTMATMEPTSEQTEPMSTPQVEGEQDKRDKKKVEETWAATLAFDAAKFNEDCTSILSFGGVPFEKCRAKVLRAFARGNRITIPNAKSKKEDIVTYIINHKKLGPTREILTNRLQ